VPPPEWDDRDGDVDLGSGFSFSFMAWDPDRELNPQYDGVPSIERYGALIYHPDARDPAKRHMSAIIFDTATALVLEPKKPKWQVQSYEPLTISPSVFCNPAKGGCGAHGFIREGRWIGC
jgi:hypothetical protein